MWAPMAASGVFEGASFAEAFRSVERQRRFWFRFKRDPRQGEQRACAEWLARNPQFEVIEYWREGPQAMSFLASMK